MIHQMSLKDKLKVAYECTQFPQRKMVVDLIKLLISKPYNFEKEYHENAITYTVWLSNVSISIYGEIGNNPVLYVNGEFVSTDDCSDLMCELVCAIDLAREPRSRNISPAIEKAIHILTEDDR